MENLSGWMREIAALLIFVVFLELLIPRSSLVPLIRVVTGLLILVTILKPVVVWMHDFHPMEISLNDRGTAVLNADRDPMSFLKAAYEQEMKRRVSAYLDERGYGGQEVAVSMEIAEDRIKTVSITAIVSAADTEQVRADICTTFDLPAEAVTIERGGR